MPEVSEIKKEYKYRKIKKIGIREDRKIRRDKDKNLIFLTSYLLIFQFFFLSGCAVNQDKEISTYRDVLSKSSNEPPEQLEPNQPLTLIRAMEMANWHNEQLAIKGEQYLQSLIDKDRAVSNFLPQIAFVPTYTQQQKVTFPGALASIASEIVPPHTLDQPLDTRINLNVPADVANAERAKSAAEAQKNLLLDLKSTILLDVARAYYQIMLSESSAKVLENSVSVQHDRVTNVRNKYKAGTARQLDVTQAEAQLSRTKVSLIKVRNDIATGRATLALLINTPSVGGSLSDQLTLPAKLPSGEELLSAAWKYREDLKAAHHQVEVSVHTLQQAWRRYFPSISLNFTYFLNRQSFPSQVSWIYSLGINIPLFTAGLVHDDVRTAWSMLRQAKLNESYLQRQVSEQFAVALENYNETEKQANELEVLVRSAQDELQTSIYSYNAGLATNLDTIIARNQLLNAQLSLTETKFSEKINFLNLMRILGHFDSESLTSGFKEQLKYDTEDNPSEPEDMTLHAESER